jgi:hypothetical protein
MRMLGLNLSVIVMKNVYFQRGGTELLASYVDVTEIASLFTQMYKNNNNRICLPTASFCVVTTWSVVGGYRSFGGTYCFHVQDICELGLEVERKGGSDQGGQEFWQVLVLVKDNENNYIHPTIQNRKAHCRSSPKSYHRPKILTQLNHSLSVSLCLLISVY